MSIIFLERLVSQSRIEIWCSRDPVILLIWKDKKKITSFNKYLKKITDVVNSVFHNNAKNQLKILCISSYIKMKKL